MNAFALESLNTDVHNGRLADTCLLVVLKVSQFGTTLVDKAESRKVASDKGANRNRFKVTKRTLVAPELDRIKEIAGAARGRFTFLTRPWAVSGCRILPGAMWFEFEQEMNEHRAKFDQAADIAALHWEDIIERNRPQLGSGFDRSDYPPAEKFRAAYSFSCDPYTFPTSDSFFSNCMDDAAIEDIKRRQEEATTHVLAEGCRQVWQGVYDAVANLQRQYSAYETDEKGNRSTRLHSTLVTNLRAIVKNLPALNLERDPELDRMAREIDSKLCATPVEAIKENDYQRREIAKDAEAILASMSAFVGN